MVKRAVIFANGKMSAWPGSLSLHPENDIIIAADGGADLCQQWDVSPHVLIGDLDSVTPGLLAQYEAAQVEIFRYPTSKDETDLELALRYAQRCGVSKIVVLGALGHRWDMTLSNVMLLSASFLSNTAIYLLGDQEKLLLLQGGEKVTLHGQVGDNLSLVPISSVEGLTISGSAYTLFNASLAVGSTHAISNRFARPEVQLSLAKGLVLAIHSFIVK